MGDFSTDAIVSNIIPFQRSAKSRAAAPPQAHEGRILFFTGVRYERMQEPEAAPEGRPDQPAHGGPGRKKRRRA